MPPLPTLTEGQILTGSLFNEPMRVETVAQTGPSWTLGLVGTRSERFRKVSLGATELAGLTVLDSGFRYDGDGWLLRLGLQAHALGIAWEFEPYFGLSVSRVDPLPHQLEAVYDHLLKLARVRFLLADDAGAGKTIMAGLLIRELQLRGLAERILIVAPSNLAFQWQRELQEKFDQTFVVLKGSELRAQFGVNQWMQQPKVVTSLDLAKREEILPGLRQVHWDMVVVDEAPPDVGARRVAQEPALQAGRAAAGFVRPHTALDRNAAQGGSRELLALPAASRPRRLRRRAFDTAGDGRRARAVLPAAHEGGDGLLPGAGCGRALGGAQDLHEAHSRLPPTSRSTGPSSSCTSR